MSNFDKINEQSFVCTECQSGKMQLKHLAYLTWLGNELVVVPDFPAWVCDVCGRREDDINALNRLSLILSPNAGKSSVSKRRIIQEQKSKPRPSTTS